MLRGQSASKRIRWAVACVAAVLCVAFVVPKLVFAGAGDAPSDLHAVAGTQPVIASLTWNPAPDSSPDHYRVSVSLQEDGPYAPAGVVQGTSFDYSAGLGGMTYYFRVWAVDSSGVESDYAQSGPVTAAWALTPHGGAGQTVNTCGMCHVPHVSQATFLGRDELATSSPDPTSLCVPCHDGRVTSAANVTSGTANSFSLPSGHTLAGSSSDSLVRNCSSCHIPHAREESSPMLPGRKVNGVDIAADGSGWCVACHDSADSWFGPGYPSTSAPTRDATGFPVSGTWPGPDTYSSGSNAHRLIAETTQTSAGGGRVVRAQGDCLYCHAAHRGPNGYDGLVAQFRPSTNSTLATDQANGVYAALCLACHGKTPASGFTGATAGANIAQFVATGTPSAGHRIMSAGGNLPVGAPLPCYDCHNPHGSRRGNASLISDERGRSLETSSATGVRHFCLTCHSTADQSSGWDSSSNSYVAVGVQTIEGLPRSGGALRLPDLIGHNESSSTSCESCHGHDYSAGGNNVHDPSPSGGYDAATHRAAPPAQGFVIGGTTFASVECTSCHSLELGVEHAKSSSDGSAQGCDLCHPYPRSSLTPSWDHTTCAQGECHTATSTAPMHADIDADHAVLPAYSACAQCHSGTLADIHVNASTEASGSTRTSCGVCHTDGVPASNDCASCHDAANPHGALDASHTATMGSSDVSILGTDFGSHDCSECHPSAVLTTIHADRCSTCHPSPRDTVVPWDKSCATGGCHTATSSAPQHGRLDSAHAVGTLSCTSLGCHAGGGNAAAIHSKVGCVACHASGVTPSTDCAACHNLGSPHEGLAGAHTATNWVTTTDIVALSHYNQSSGAPDVSASLDCIFCHSTNNIAELHGNNCAVCHSGPAGSFTTWNRTCQQGECHPSMHTKAPTGGEHGGTGLVCSCHEVGGGFDVPPSATDEQMCGPCHGIVDTTPPTTISDAKATYEGAATVHLTASDNIGGSGVGATYYRVDGGGTASGSTVVIATSGLHSLEFWSTDVSGNSETPHHTVTFTVTITDTVAPTTVSDVVGSYSNIATVHLSAADNPGGSGVATTYYRLDGGVQKVGTTVTTTVLGAHNLEFWSVDHSANAETPHKTATFTVVDTIAPTTTSDVIGIYNASASVHLTATDNAGGSGVATTYYKLDGGAQTAGSTASTSVLGAHSLEYWSVDNAGNAESPHKTASFTVSAGIGTVVFSIWNDAYQEPAFEDWTAWIRDGSGAVVAVAHSSRDGQPVSVLVPVSPQPYTADMTVTLYNGVDTENLHWDNVLVDVPGKTVPLNESIWDE